MRERFRAMALRLLLGLALATTWSLPAGAQEGGTLQGQVTNGTTGGRPVPDLEVTLSIYGADAPPFIPPTGGEGGGETLATQTDAEGVFRFTGLSTAKDIVYQVGVNYQQVDYWGEALSFAAGQDTLDADVVVYEATESDAAVSIERGHLVVEFAAGGLAVTEMLVLRNDGDGTYIGSGPELAPDKIATLRFPLPSGAELVNIGESLMQCCVVSTDEGFVDTMPVLPGMRTVLYVYTLPYQGRTMDVRRVFAYPTGSLDIFLGDENVQVDVSGFSHVEAMETLDGTYARWTSGGLAAREPVVIRLQGVPFGKEQGSERTVVVRKVAGWGFVAAALVLLVLAYPLWRRWRALPETAEKKEPVAGVDVGKVREALLQRVADLDEAFEASDISTAEYHVERAVLKRRLLDLWEQATEEEIGK